MSSQDERMLPPLKIEGAKPVVGQPYAYELSLKNVGPDGANVTIAATDIGTSKDRLQIFIGGTRVVDHEFDNNPPKIIRTHITRQSLLEHLGTKAIHYMIRIGQGNGEISEKQTYRITH